MQKGEARESIALSRRIPFGKKKVYAPPRARARPQALRRLITQYEKRTHVNFTETNSSTNLRFVFALNRRREAARLAKKVSY